MHTPAILLLLAATLAWGGVANASEPAPIRVNVADLAAHPLRYDGRWVRVRGQVSDCTRFGCSLCPEKMKDSSDIQCVGLSLDTLDEGRPDTPTAQRARALLEESVRYALVTVEGRLDASCARPGMSCTDDGGVYLGQARVLKVTPRSVNEAVFSRPFLIRALTPAPPAEAATILATAARAWGELEAGQSQAALLVEARPGEAMLALACICWSDSRCEGRWPTHLTPVLDSPGNPFFCSMLVRDGTGWRNVH